MIVKPLAFGMVVVLVVVAAGTGAYLAVRQNDAFTSGLAETAALGAEFPDGSDTAETLVVESTEEVLDEQVILAADAPVAGTPAPEVSRSAATRVPQRRAAAAATAPEESAADPVVAATPPREAQPPSAARDLPEVDGWTRLEEPRPSLEPAYSPERVVLTAADTSSLGIGLDPEERPRIIEELVIGADSVVGLQIDTPVSTEDAEVEDDVEARVTRDVIVGDQIAVPAGTRVMGSVVLVEQAGQLKGVSRLGVRFHTVVMDDGMEVPLVTETLYREGRAQGGDSAAKIGGGAVGGAILGAIFGGRQGAAIGGAAGAAGGSAVAMAGNTQPATLPAGATVTVRLSSPATVTIER